VDLRSPARCGTATRALVLPRCDDDVSVLAALGTGAYGYTLKEPIGRDRRRRTGSRSLWGTLRGRDRGAHASALRPRNDFIALSRAHRTWDRGPGVVGRGAPGTRRRLGRAGSGWITAAHLVSRSSS